MFCFVDDPLPHAMVVSSSVGDYLPLDMLAHSHCVGDCLPLDMLAHSHCVGDCLPLVMLVHPCCVGYILSVCVCLHHFNSMSQHKFNMVIT